MTSTRVFWPKTGIRRNEGLVLGLRVEDVVVVVGIVEEWVRTKLKMEADVSLRRGHVCIPT